NFAQRSEENRDNFSSKNDEKIQRSIDNTPYGVEVTFEPKRKGLIADFERPRELVRRNGELLEVFTISIL
uniref:Uncharacterized protein n=1 Tax=Oryza glaberrima TaxID=4538 RepID=I1NNX8_ORYGL